VKEEWWQIHPQGVAGHTLGHWGGSAGLEVAEPPLWPKGVVRPTPVGGSATLLLSLFFSLTGGGPLIWWWPSHPIGLRGGQPPPVGGSATLLLSLFFFFFNFFKKKFRFKNLKLKKINILISQNAPFWVC
jgi:hypothetical protein